MKVLSFKTGDIVYAAGWLSAMDTYISIYGSVYIVRNYYASLATDRAEVKWK